MSSQMTANPMPAAQKSAMKRPIPPLENGDRLAHAEYIKRYAATPPKLKVERIEGMVYMPAAAVSANFHGQPHADMIWWLTSYRFMTPGTGVADNSTVFLDSDNDPQPDACLYILPSHGGRTKLTPEGYIEGCPELIVEIAASSMSYDLGAKLNAYRRNGVKEYIVHRTYDGELDWFVLREGQFEKRSPDAEGVYRSESFPGLWLAGQSMIEGNLAEVLAVLQMGLASVEHEAFAKKLVR